MFRVSAPEQFAPTKISNKFFLVLVRAFMHSRMDYCNALFTGFPVGRVTRLQSVLRAATRLVPGRALVSAAMHNSLSTASHVTSCACLLKSAYKAVRPSTSLVLVFRLSLSQVVLSSVRLATTSFSCLERRQLYTFGPRAFFTSGPDAWNTLSSELCHSSVSLDCFKRSLKTFLFIS